MSAGQVTLTPNDSVFDFERKLVESGWGQIPVVDDSAKLIGIVTRTDLLKYWSKQHPTLQAGERQLTIQQFESVLGQQVTHHIRMVAERAQADVINVYLVGGVVRDLLLGRPNFDIDFVVEGSAISFAESIQKEQGGHLTAFQPFGTAKWKPQSDNSDVLDVLEHIDFASARYEFYEHPTALPTVYDSSIKLDLQRRDFTINTLAIQISPASLFGRVVDFYGGLQDLNAKLIRVLHSLSFIDDPTRILRAFRFERRLSFTIEARTAELIKTASPMLGRITGERIRNELTLLLKENQPENGLMNLQQQGILSAIQPAFVINNQVVTAFQNARSQQADGMPVTEDWTDLYWHILLCQLDPQTVKIVSDRLMFGRRMGESLLQASEMVHQKDKLSQADIRPSTVVGLLEKTSLQALLAVWYVVDDERVRNNLSRYWMTWRHILPKANGNTLREMGLKAGPCYSAILLRLRQAWLDGIIQKESEERSFLNRLIHDERICDDHT
jgi:tRNA nucleotidyltransferase (CCA-adding enzyme)